MNISNTLIGFFVFSNNQKIQKNQSINLKSKKIVLYFCL